MKFEIFVSVLALLVSSLQGKTMTKRNPYELNRLQRRSTAQNEVPPTAFPYMAAISDIPERRMAEVHPYEAKSIGLQTRSTARDVALPHAFPYIAAISFNHTYRGPGALITPQWVITTADYVSSDMKLLRVHLGVHNFSSYEPTQQIISVDEVIIHGEFTGGVQNDIALLHLTKEAILNDYVKTVLVAPFNAPDYAGSSLQNVYFDSLILSNLTVFGISDSVSEYAGIDFGPGLISANADGTGAGLCYSYGQALIDPDSGVLVGLLAGCNSATAALFTRVSYFNQWIIEHIH